MNYIPFHHKYRPQTFSELVGQEVISQTLTNAITSNRIAPAYLFVGPRGTGKTSSARILAKSLNCLASERPTPTPCGDCAVCLGVANGSVLDIIEIDAASNSGVENIRELIESAQFAPVQCRYKVYCIDECHSLSNAAVQALLKTLEEPPQNVVFVLCTTEPIKLPNTVISRCFRFNFRPIAPTAMVAHLEYIAAVENIDIEPEALARVVLVANGGLRDAESLLDSLALLGFRITVQLVDELVGAVPAADLQELLKAIASNEPTEVLNSVRTLLAKGLEPMMVLLGVAEHYSQLLLEKSSTAGRVSINAPSRGLSWLANRLDTATILKSQQHLRSCEAQLRQAALPHIWLEIALLGLLPSSTMTSTPQAALPPTPMVESTIAFKGSRPALALGVGEELGEKVSKNAPSPADALWQQVLQQQTPALAALLRQHSQLNGFDGKTASIGVRSEPLRQRVESALAQIEAAFAQLTANPIKVVLSCLS